MGYVTPNALERGPFGDLKPLAAALTMGFGLTLTPATYAANFVVSTTADSGAGSLRDAVSQALLSSAPRSVSFSLPPSSSITLTSGKIRIDQDLAINGPGSSALSIVTTSGNSQPIFYLYSSNPTVTISGLTLQRTSGTTTGDGGAIYNYGGTLTVLNSVITGHSATGRGGAIFSRHGTVNVTSSTLSNNTVTNSGGAVYMYYGTVNVTGSTLSGNQSAGGTGGAISVYAGSLSITNSTLSSNKAYAGGGAVYAHGYYYYYYYNYTGGVSGVKNGNGKGHKMANAAVTAHAVAKASAAAKAQAHAHAHANAQGNVKVHIPAKTRKHDRRMAHAKSKDPAHAHVARNGPMAQQRRAQIAANHAAVMGNRVSAQSFHTPVSITITGSTFSGNQAGTSGGGDDGGALYLKYANATIQDSTFSGNSTDDDGGAIYHRKGNLNISGSTFSNNTANFGSAISRNDYYEFNNTTIANSTFSGNTATIESSYRGGAVFFNSQPVTIRNSTFTGNTASGGAGGAITLYGAALTLQSTILANSSDSTGNRDIFAVNADGPSFSIAADHSLIVNGGGFVPFDATNILATNPLLGPLVNNGGPTLTHALSVGSPAIDKGSNPTALAFDQRGSGFPRTVGVQTDIGAVEGPAGPPPPPPVSLVPIPTLSHWGLALLSMLLGAWAAITGFARRRPDKDS